MDFLEVLKKLSETEAEFIIVGGVAARVYGSRRLTHDIDLVPQLDSHAWPRLVQIIWDLGGRPRIPESLEAIQDLKKVKDWVASKNMLALSFRSSDGLTEIDLLVGEADNFEVLKKNSREVETAGCVFRVVGLDDLLAMKKKAGRPQDLLDIEELERIKASLDEGTE